MTSTSMRLIFRGPLLGRVKHVKKSDVELLYVVVVHAVVVSSPVKLPPKAGLSCADVKNRNFCFDRKTKNYSDNKV